MKHKSILLSIIATFFFAKCGFMHCCESYPMGFDFPQELYPASKPIPTSARVKEKHKESEVLIEKKIMEKSGARKPFESCMKGSVPPLFCYLLERMQNPLLYRLQDPEVSNPPNFYLLYGKSGTGKTFLIDTFIKEVGTSSVHRTGGQLSLAHRETIQNIEAMFVEARKNAEQYGSCVVCIDECEPAFIDRNALTLNNQAFHGASTLWKYIDEHRNSHPNILVLAATNLFESLDEALKNRLYARAIKIPYEEPKNSLITQTFLSSEAGIEQTEEKLLNILNYYRRTQNSRWPALLGHLKSLDNRIITEVAEEAVRLALYDYYKELKPQRLKELEIDYLNYKKLLAQQVDQDEDSSKMLHKLSEIDDEVKILTQALHSDALENVIIRQKYIKRVLKVVLLNRAYVQPSLLKRVNEITKEYGTLISAMVGVVGIVMTLQK